METQFVTVKSGSEEYHDLLDGRFSSKERAIPVPSVGQDFAGSAVTFQIQPSEQLQISLVQLVARLGRWSLFSLVVGPWAFVLIDLFLAGVEFSVWRPLMLLVSLFGVHLGVMALNDYRDHISGFDRRYRSGGSRLIQEGAIEAYKLKQIGYGSLLVATLLAVPLFFHWETDIILTSVVALLSVGFLLWGGSFFKRVELTTLAVFLCFGPLLVSGMVLALDAQLTKVHLIVGCVMGFYALYSLLLKHFETIFSDHQMGAPTWAGQLGFDGAKAFLSSLLMGGMLLTTFAAWELSVAPSALLVWSLPILYAASIAFKVYRCPSPLSSQIKGVRYLGIRLHLLVLIAFGFSLWL